MRPTTLGEILDRAFEIYRKRFWFFVTVGALPATLLLALRSADVAWIHTDNLVNQFSDGEVTRGGYIAWNWVVSYGYSHISGFLLLLVFPALLHIASCEVFGESTTVIASLRFALARWRRYLWLAVLVITAVLILPEALTFGVFFGTGTLEDRVWHGDFPGIPAIVILLAEIPAGFVLILWAKLCFAFSVPAAAFENFAAANALRRSWSLTKGSRWRILIAWFAVVSCNLTFSLVGRYAIKWTVYYGYSSFHLRWMSQHLVSEAMLVYYALVESIVLPIYAVAITLLYYDQRVRKEGYDLELMMQSAGLTGPEPEILDSPEPQAEKTPSRWARIPRDSWDRL